MEDQQTGEERGVLGIRNYMKEGTEAGKREGHESDIHHGIRQVAAFLHLCPLENLLVPSLMIQPSISLNGSNLTQTQPLQCIHSYLGQPAVQAEWEKLSINFHWLSLHLSSTPGQKAALTGPLKSHSFPDSYYHLVFCIDWIILSSNVQQEHCTAYFYEQLSQGDRVSMIS